MSKYETVIGLEVHAQLSTRTKLFCGCSTKFTHEPNTNVCPVCTGMPGVLPVLNAKALEYAAKASMALNCTLNPKSVFARKNYFYPDLPKGYQISQYENPLAEHGHVDVTVNGQTRRIGITRVHMEDDAGKSIHSKVENVSFVDLNRSGVPLIEIVSEPDIRSAEEAAEYLRIVHRILVYLEICDGNMEEGSFRCDANVSLRPRGQKEFGTRAELKNMNSFRNVQRAIEYEIKRQEDILEDGGKIIQETRLFDADKGVTWSMRGKEEAHDYRYFPDPDLIPPCIDESIKARWLSELPELPQAKLDRFIGDYGLSENDAQVLCAEKSLADYYDGVLKNYADPKKAANWIMTELLRELNTARIPASRCALRPGDFASLLAIIDAGEISVKIGKDILPDLFKTGGSPKEYVKAKGLVQISDSDALEQAVDAVLAENPAEVEAFRGGKTKLMSFFVGQIMKKTKGRANPALVNQLLADKLA